MKEKAMTLIVLDTDAIILYRPIFFKKSLNTTAK